MRATAANLSAPSVRIAALQGLNKLAENRAPVPPIRLYLWPHRLLLLGPGFDTGLHRHHAAQICFGLDGPLRLRTASGGSWLEHAGFYVPPDHPHEFAAEIAGTAIIYVEAESAEFAALREAPLVGNEITPLEREPQRLAPLRALIATGGTIEQADETCRAVLGLKEATEPHTSLDPRIAKCLRIIRSKLDQRLRLAALAAALNVSESWLAHRFPDEVGVPMRRYILWQRLWRAVEFALKGATLTEAAYAAGLSDSAHLSRAFRETFGVTPSFLFEHRDQLKVHFSSEHG